MKKTGLAVMLAAALLAGSLSVYADEIDTENPGMEETAEAQEAEPEEEPVPDTSNNVEEAGAAEEVTGEEESGEGDGGAPAEETSVPETQEDQGQQEEEVPADVRTAPGDAEGINPADGVKTDDAAEEEGQKEEQEEEQEEEKEDGEEETAGKAALELNSDSRPFNAETEGQLGTKEHPYRYLVSENETVKVYKEFLLQLIGTAQQEGKEACWISLEAHTGDDPQAEISVWNGEKNQFLADVYSLADPENADGYAWYTDTVAEELTLDLHAAEKALKYGETTVLADRSKDDAEEAVEEAPLLLRGGAGEGGEPETPEEPEPAVITLTEENCTVTLEYSTVNGDGTPKEPAETVVYTHAGEGEEPVGTTLVKDTDYTVEYKNNTAPGKAEVIIHGIKTETGGYEDDGTVKADFTIQNVAVTGVKLNKAKVTLAGKGKTYTLTATVSPANATNKAVTWKSNRTGVVTVDQTGKITAKTTGGVATITVVAKDTSKNAEPATCIVTVEGFVKETVGGKTITRYYKDGGFLKGKQKLKIDGVEKYYYFDEKTGAMQTGMQTITDTASPAQSAAAAEGHTYEILCAKDAGFAMDVYGGSANSRANIDIYKRNGSDAQRFILNQQADGSWRILNVKGKALDIAGGSTAGKANVQTYTWNGTDAQKFTIQKNADGTVTIINKKSGLALDVSGGKMQNKQNVQQYASNNTAAQKWILADVTKYYFDSTGIMQTGWQKVGNTWYYFFPKTGVMATGFQKIDGKWYYFASDGARRTGWQTVAGKKYYFGTDGAAEAGWYAVSEKETKTGAGTAYSSASPVSGHTYAVLSAKDQNFALDVAGGSYKARANVDIYRKNGTEAQSFLFTKQNDGSWKIQNFKGMVLDISGASKADKANVQTYGWNGTNAQKFLIQENEDGSVTFLNKNSGKALDVSGGKMLNKQNVQQYTSNGTAAQKWILVDVTKYYINDKGTMLTGWQTISGKKYYFLSNGVMATGWRTIAGKKYYFGSDGVMATGQQSIGGYRYMFEPGNGAMITGFYTHTKETNPDGVKVCYYDGNGRMVLGKVEYRGAVYLTDRNTGALLNWNAAKASMQPDQMIYYYQKSDTWYSYPYGWWKIGDSGCGLCSFTMIASLLKGTTMTPPEVADVVNQHTGSMFTPMFPGIAAFTNLARYYGLSSPDVRHYSRGSGVYDKAYLQKKLEQGCPMILNGHSGGRIFTSDHFIAIYGQGQNGPKIYDPGWDSRCHIDDEGVTWEAALSSVDYVIIFEPAPSYTIG